jgi:hypothetical protein
MKCPGMPQKWQVALERSVSWRLAPLAGLLLDASRLYGGPVSEPCSNLARLWRLGGPLSAVPLRVVCAALCRRGRSTLSTYVADSTRLLKLSSCASRS